MQDTELIIIGLVFLTVGLLVLFNPRNLVVRAMFRNPRLQQWSMNRTFRLLFGGGYALIGAVLTAMGINLTVFTH
jgi:hypothetical protein